MTALNQSSRAFLSFDLEESLNILALKMSSNLCSIYLDEDLIYVADSSGIYCLDLKGKLILHNTNLGIDDVLVHDFSDSKYVEVVKGILWEVE